MRSQDPQSRSHKSVCTILRFRAPGRERSSRLGSPGSIPTPPLTMPMVGRGVAVSRPARHREADVVVIRLQAGALVPPRIELLAGCVFLSFLVLPPTSS